MNRFSPKQTLSNIATAVRETVDSVNKNFFAITLIVVVALPFYSHAQNGALTVSQGSTTNGLQLRSVEDQLRYDAETDKREQAKKEKALTDYETACGGEENQNSAKCAAYMAVNRITPPSSSHCERFATEIGKHSDQANQSCSKIEGTNIQKCVTKVAMCLDVEEQLNTYNDKANSESAEYCDASLANKCPALSSFMNGRDYRQEKKDAETERKEAKRELDDLMEDDRKSKKEIAAEQRELKEKQENAALAFRRKQDALMEKMEDAIEGISASQKKAFDDAQNAASQMEVEYIKMRADQRGAADMVAQAEDDLLLMCRQSAEKQYQEAEKARSAAEKKGKKNLGTSVSGAAKRNKQATAQQQQIDFQKFYSQCTSGSSADGVGGRNRIATAKRAKDTADKLMAEKAAMIEKQRLQMQAKLQQMEADSTNQKSKAVDAIQKQFTQMNEEKALVDRQNQARLAELANNNLQANLSMQNRMAEANRRLMTTQTEASVALTRMNCAGSAARTSESKKDATSLAYGSAVTQVENLKRVCGRADRAGCKMFEEECKSARTISTVLPASKRMELREPGSGGRVEK